MSVKVEVQDRIVIITIDRPEARNAIDGATTEALEHAIDQLEEDDHLWVGIITGSPPAFCSGADLKATRDGEGKSMFTRRGGFAGITAHDRSKPLIAAVNGPALAGGTEIVLACDLVAAAPDATFGLPEVTRSLVASAGGLFRLARKIPVNIAMECALTGQPITAQRAFDLGLVNVLCDEDNVVVAAIQLGQTISAAAPIAVRESRSVMLESTWATDESAWALSRAALRRVQDSEDYVEGLNAFVERRLPEWRAR